MAPTKPPPHTAYPSLQRIDHPGTREVAKLLMDKIGAVEQVTPNIGKLSQPLDTHLDFNTNRGVGLADPQAPTDAVNQQTMERYVAAAIKKAIDALP